MPTIIGPAGCPGCLTPFQQLVTSVETLATYLESIMADCDALDKLDQCCASSMTPFQLQTLMMELGECLLNSIVAGVGAVLCGTDDPPVADPGVDCAKYYNVTNGKEWNWNDGAGTWDETIG